MRQARLRNAQFGCGPGERAVFGNGDQCLQMTQLDHWGEVAPVGRPSQVDSMRAAPPNAARLLPAQAIGWLLFLGMAILGQSLAQSSTL